MSNIEKGSAVLYTKNFYHIKSNDYIYKALQEEKQHIGYYTQHTQETKHIKQYCQNIAQKHIVVVGIGGSSLGAKAIYEFLDSSRNFSKKLHFLETTDPLSINKTLRNIPLEDSHFCIISKSGDTIETIANFKYLLSLCVIDHTNSTVITQQHTALHRYAATNDTKTFFIDGNIGGRFSVFSVVGLVPLAMVGVDIDQLQVGSAKVIDGFFDKKRDEIVSKARFLVENKNRFNINVLFSYSSGLESFNKWYVQLWGESLGKLNINGTRQGLTPVGLVGPIDQHSFLQLIMDGTRDKTVTFVKVDDPKDDTTIPDTSLKHLSSADILNGISFAKLINTQADATIKAVQDKSDIPCDVITITTVDEYNIAKLMTTFMLLVSCIGKFVQIDTYDQPGVESGKKILKKMLLARD